MKFLYVLVLVALAYPSFAEERSEDNAAVPNTKQAQDGDGADQSQADSVDPFSGLINGFMNPIENVFKTLGGQPNGKSNSRSESISSHTEQVIKNGKVLKNESGGERRVNDNGREAVQKFGDDAAQGADGAAADDASTDA